MNMRLSILYLYLGENVRNYLIGPQGPPGPPGGQEVDYAELASRVMSYIRGKT